MLDIYSSQVIEELDEQPIKTEKRKNCEKWKSGNLIFIMLQFDAIESVN